VERAERTNPLAMELLASIASKSINDLSLLPLPALRAMINFHRVEYLHNLERARLYAQRADASNTICNEAFTTLTAKLTLQPDTNEIYNSMVSESASQAPRDEDVIIPDAQPPSALVDPPSA
jgi:hypothetical protein